MSGDGMTTATLAPFAINGRRIGPGEPVYVIAEISSNHGQRFDAAVELVHGAHAAGADAVKLQTYTPDTITIDADLPAFVSGEGSLWEGTSLHALYQTAYMPWDWQPKLKAIADELGMDLFSAPFDPTAVDFLDGDGCAGLQDRLVRVGRPAAHPDGRPDRPADHHVDRDGHRRRDRRGRGRCPRRRSHRYRSPQVLECISLAAGIGEPAGDPTMAERWGVPIGLSDHTKGIAVPAAAVALGATLVEKHVTLSHADATPDEQFSLDLTEFAAMVDAIRTVERAMGSSRIGPTDDEAESRRLRRSLFVVEDVVAGEPFTARNLRSIRPAVGMHTREYERVLGRRAAVQISRGTPLSPDLLEPELPR